jgi:hypothetical protein
VVARLEPGQTQLAQLIAGGPTGAGSDTTCTTYRRLHAPALDRQRVTGIKVNLVTPAFTSTNLNGYEGTESIEAGAREVVRVALLGPDGPSGTFTRWENVAVPW